MQIAPAAARSGVPRRPHDRVRLVLERRLTQILVDLPDALSREQPGVSRSTADNQRPTTPSASTRPVRGASPPPRPIPPTSNAAAPPPEPPTLRGAPSTCARASR